MSHITIKLLVPLFDVALKLIKKFDIRIKTSLNRLKQAKYKNPDFNSFISSNS